MLFSNKSQGNASKFRFTKRTEKMRLRIVDSLDEIENNNDTIPFEDYTNNGKIPMYEGYAPANDPFGSYTGVCEDIHEKPVQDADDL